MGKPSTRIYEFGPFRLVEAERTLLRNGQPLALTPKAFDTLLVLVENCGRVVQKDELMSRVWPDTFVAEVGLARNISVLRKILGGDSADNHYIETIPKRGYRFTPSVKQFADDELIVRRARVRIVTEEIDEAEEQTSIEGRPRLPEALRSLAVLPFKLLGVDAAEEYLGMGLADALITKLSNIRRIIVRPTSAVLRYSGLTQDARSAGRELQVGSVLDGTVQRLGERIRVTVQLVSVDAGATLWAEKFDEALTDLFEIEDRMSEQLVTALTLELTSWESRILAKRYTANSEAYRSYLKGRYFWNKRSPEALAKAVECFGQAIARDPGYALAYAGLADSYNISGFWIFLPPTEAFPRAAAAANAALKLDDALAEAHASLAWAILHHDWDRAAAEREYQRAIELNPGYATAHQWYALFLMQEARFDEAFPEIKRAQKIDPLSLAVSFNFGLLPFLAGRYDEAIAQLRKTVDLEPRFFTARQFIALSYGFKSMIEECVAEYEHSVALLRSSANLAGLGLGYAIAGRAAEARAVLAELEDGETYAYTSPVSVAQIYLYLGEKNRAYECLEQGDEERDPWMLWNQVNPVFESIRSEPRFKAILRRTSLAE